MMRTLLRTRGAPWAALGIAVTTAISAALGPKAITIELSHRFRPNELPVSELCALVGSAITALVTRPRFWEWDRLGLRRRSAWVAGLTAGVGITLPCTAVLVALPTVHVAWTWVLANALGMSAIVFLLSPLISPAFAGMAGIVLWSGFGVLGNIAPTYAVLLPTTPYPGPDGNWTITATLILAAILVHARTRGATAWAHRMFHKER